MPFSGDKMSHDIDAKSCPSSVSPPEQPSALPKGRAKACTNCRQVKLRCNARETWPNPCFRCRNQGTECKMDSSFKRVPARRQLEEVSQKLNSLQRLLNSSQGPPAPSVMTRAAMHPEEGTQGFKQTKSIGERSTGFASQRPLPTFELSPGHFVPHEPSSQFLNLADEERDKSWALGGVTVTYEVAEELLAHFDEQKWQHIPILRPCSSIEKLYASSDLLFWTIILQAARNHGSYASIYSELLPHHRLLLGAGLLGQYNIETLHSLLLIATWPYPNPRQTPAESTARILRNRDPSWMLLGAALNMATMMGLHKPGHQEEFGYDDREMDRSEYSETYIRNVTWLYVFQLSTSQSSWLGIAPPISSASHLETMATLCQDESIPEWIRAKGDVQRRVAQFTIQLDTTLDLRTRYSLVNVFEQYLDRARDKFGNVWSQSLEVDYLGAKLYLYGIAFVNSPKNLGYIPVEDPGIMARNILQRGMTAAVRLCHTACNMNFREIIVPGAEQTHMSSYAYQLSWFPKRFNLAIAFATIFLAWFLAVDTQALEGDRKLARKHMDDVRRLYASFHHSQEHMNIGRKLENLTTLPMTAPNLTVSSRLGASFMYSYNFMYKYLKSLDPKISAESRKGKVPDSTASDVHPLGHANIETSPLMPLNGGADVTPSDASTGQDPTALLPDSWDMPWSEWDPVVFEELQNLSWGQSPWDVDDVMISG